MRLPTINDVFRAGTEQMEALMALPRSMVVLNRSLTSLAETVTVLDQLVRRLDRLTEPLEGPLTALAPRLEALVPLFDEEVIESLPAVLDSVERNLVPALEVMGSTRAQVASIATSVERLMSIMDDSFSRLQEMPGAFLISRLRGAGRVPRTASAPDEASGPPPEGTPTPGPPAPDPPAEATATPGPPAPDPPAEGTAAPGPPAPGRPVARPPARTAPGAEEHRSWRA